MNEPATGSTLGRYELLVRLGRGGMASVWVARELKPVAREQRLVAVKAMLPELAQASEFRAMFLEEGQIVKSIDHPNVVRVFEVGEHAGTLFMAMEWVEGDSLHAVIREARRRRPIPPEIAVKIIADAAAGLHAAHELHGWDGELRNLVHCDVSPHNILVGIDGRGKIVDFGVANARLHSDFEADERVKGKFGYMSPEQARGARLDRRSDVFSLGIVLFELTTGERLFRGENPAHTLALVTAANVPDPRRLLRDYPAGLATITLKALAADPNKRYQTAALLQDALERYLVDERVLVSHSSVAQLVRRVLGERIESVRQGVREALVLRDGVLEGGLVPELSATSFSDISASPSRTSGTPRPQTYETPVPEKQGYGPMLAAFGGIAAAAASIFWVLNRPVATVIPNARDAAEVSASDTRQQTGAAIGASGDANDGIVNDGVDIASLPLSAQSAAAAAAAQAPAPRPASRGAPPRAVPTPREVEAPEAAKPAPPVSESVELEERAAAAPAVDPAPVTKTLPTPAGPAGPFNRGAALAQLGSASGRAARCKQPAGPTGAGQATVTFSQDGSASKVALTPPFAGTSSGACLIAAFSAARVPPFTGSSVSIPTRFRVQE